MNYIPVMKFENVCRMFYDLQYGFYKAIHQFAQTFFQYIAILVTCIVNTGSDYTVLVYLT